MMTTRIKQELLDELPGAGPGNTSFRCSLFRPTSGGSSARRIRQTRLRLPIVVWSSRAGDSVAKSGTPAASSARPPFHSPAGLERPRTFGLVSPCLPLGNELLIGRSAWRPTSISRSRNASSCLRCRIECGGSSAQSFCRRSLPVGSREPRKAISHHEVPVPK